MRELFYEPYLSQYKTPVGAITVGEEFEIKIRITERDDIEKVEFVLTKDEESPVYYQMRNEGEFYVIKMKVTSVGLYFYHFKVNQFDGFFNIFANQDLKPDYHYGDEWVLLARENKYKEADFLQGGVMYQIMVDRFCSVDRKTTFPDVIYRKDWGGVPAFEPNEDGKILNNDMFGGNLAGVISKLGYLKKLGVTCIYLNPIFRAHSNHKYDTGDYMRIDDDFGTDDDLQTLINKAKRLGIKIILDGVFSHTGDDSVYFNKYGRYDSVGAYQSKKSPYYSWYTFKKYPTSYESWWGIDILPNTKETDTKFDEFINGENGVIAKYTSMGIGGWRLDVADELPDGFLDSLTKRVKKVNPKALVLGEVWEDAATKIAYSNRRQYFQGKQLESVMNYPFKDAILSFVKTANAKQINRTVLTLCDHYPKHVLHSLMNMLGTHDTQRALTMLSSDAVPTTKFERAYHKISDYSTAKLMLKMATTLLYVLPGVPCVFYGDEAGMQGYEDPFNRGCYPWGNEDKDLLTHYQNLGKMRKNLFCVLAKGDYVPIKAEGGVLIFDRVSEYGKVHVISNASEFPVELPVMVHDEATGGITKSVRPHSTVVVFEK